MQRDKVRDDDVWSRWKNSTRHYHKDELGYIHACFHKCKTALSDWGFWLGVTLSFPLEHWLWHHWPLVWLTRLLGLE